MTDARFATGAETAAADRVTRARAPAREDSRPRRLRKGRERCGARRRDGQPCQAPAIEGGLVCRRHGGSALQVQIAARRFVLLEAHYIAVIEWQEARGSPREFDALCRALQAGRELDAYELKLLQLAHLRAAVKELKASADSTRADLPESE